MRAHSPVEDTIRTRVEEHPDEVWLKFRDETYTWAEVLSNIQRAANGLLELGVRPGERVAILMGNRPEFIWTHLGIVFIGALSVPVNTSQRGATLEHILADSDSVAMVFDAKFALGEKFSASRFWDECRKHEAVEFNTLGAMISILLKQPPRPDDRDHPVRVVVDAGCQPGAWERFRDRFGVRIVEWFGMVDAPGILLNTEDKPGAMGKPVAGVEFRVVDEEGNPLPPREPGELVFKHPKGQLTYYHKLPEETEKSYAGGWFHSGDLAVMEEDGFFYFKGRKKESMRRRGENISAWEIESVINQHGSVLESAVYPVPSDLGEDEVKVEVVLKPGEDLSPEQLLDHCQGKMAHYAVPRYVEFVESLPKTESQRNQYAALRERGITENTWDRESVGYKVSRA
jgi:crotonobetaine/carnitine-CoA ligase